MRFPLPYPLPVKALAPVLLILAGILPFSLFAQQTHSAIRDDGRKVILHPNHTWTFADSGLAPEKSVFRPQHLEIPALLPDENLVQHTAFSLVYSEKHEQAKWVAYQLTAAETEKAHERSDRFLPDPSIASGSATDADYKGSGYDRGHLAPASDMGWSEKTMAESFYYSNMSPQTPSFNRGIWKKGEDLVRQWARKYGSLYVVVGPVLKPGLPSIGPNQVSVPKQYYKVLLHYSETEKKALAFLMENEASSAPLEEFVVSVDSVEKITGIDFFPALPDKEEAELEKRFCLSCWDWTNALHPEKTGTGKPAKPGKLLLCPGKNQDGSPCTHYISAPKTHCSNHSR